MAKNNRLNRARVITESNSRVHNNKKDLIAEHVREGRYL